MILLTGATGTVGSALLRRLTAEPQPLRCLVRDPRRLGDQRVRVQIALGDLAAPASFRNALRGVDTVVHLAASIRDQPGGSIEELNAIATLRLVRAAERAGARRFLFFSALGASHHSRTRFFRAKALAREAVEASALESTVFSPSIVYSPGDPWLTLLERFSYLPVIPVSGSGRARYQPIWAEDVADCVVAALAADGAAGAAFELAGPQTLSYDEIVRVAARAAGRPRRLVHLPLPLVRRSLRLLSKLAGPHVFATWEEAELMEEPMTTKGGTADAERLGVSPRPMGVVLGAP
jgi:NADH dehydrogenase